jgi:tetratricopeptide (TPR) repeat protein
MSVLVARLDRLAQEVKQVVQTAAVLGREFEVQLLTRMLQHEEDLAQIISTAEQAAIWMALNEIRYLFKHGLLRDAAYHMQVLAQRQALHALAAEALENLHTGDDVMDLTADQSTHYGELAYHCEQARLVEKAHRYAYLAGNAARDVYQNSLAVDYYSQALSLTPEENLEERYKLLLEREALFNLLGDRDAQLQDLNALTQLTETIVDSGQETRKAEVETRQAAYALNTGDYPQAVAASEKAIALAQSSRALEVAVQAHLTWSSTLWRRGEYNAASHQAVAGLGLARQIDDHQGQSRLLNMLGLIALEQNDLTQAYAYLEQSLLIAREIGDRRIEAMLLNSLGNLSGNLGDFIAAQDYYEQAHHIAREIGDRNGEGRVLGNLGWVVGTLGDYVTGRSYCERNLRIVRETGDRSAEAISLINLSSYSVRQGDQQAALTYAEQSLALAHATGDRSGEAWALTYLGHAHFESGQTQAAAKDYQAGLEIRRSLGQPNLATEPLAGLARIAMANGDHPTAQDHIRPILTHLDSGKPLEGTDEPLRVYLTCYQVLQGADDPHAAAIIETAYNHLQEQAAKIGDESTRHNFLQNISYHREILDIWESLRDAGPEEDGE